MPKAHFLRGLNHAKLSLSLREQYSQPTDIFVWPDTFVLFPSVLIRYCSNSTSLTKRKSNWSDRALSEKRRYQLRAPRLAVMMITVVLDAIDAVINKIKSSFGFNRTKFLFVQEVYDVIRWL